MKRFGGMIALALCGLVLVTSCSKHEVAVTKISLKQPAGTTTIKVGETITLIATVEPEDATNKNVFWSSSASSVATVDKNGVVTAVSPGKAVITVTTEDGGKTATCEVTVESAVVPVTGVTLNSSSLSLKVGETTALAATVLPENASNKKVSWSSSDQSVATVQNGVVTAVKAGTATITVTTEDGGKTATCTVTVSAEVVHVTGVSLNQTSVELVEGKQTTLTATITPSNATNKKVSWSSSNQSVATVQNGVVTAVKAGTATITVTTEDGGKTATCEVEVYQSSTENPKEGNPDWKWKY